MKKILLYITLLLGSTVFVASCEDWSLLDEHPKEVSASTFLSNSSEVQSMINSIYYQLRRNPGFGRYLSIIPESMSDYCEGRGNYATSFETGLTAGGKTMIKDSWAVLYRGIRIANQVLAEMGDADLSNSEYNKLSAEARFLRAFCYSYLVKYWGAVPFFDETNMDNYNKPRTPSEDIWKFIVSEATYASENLPESASEAGHPTKYTALMLLTEADMYLEQWSDAANAVSQVVESGKFSLVEVASSDDFQNLYGASANATTEEIFYFKYNRDDGETFEWMFLSKPNPVFNTGALGIYTDYVNNKFISGWDKNDLRYKWDLYIQTKNGTLNALTKTGMICLKYRDYGTNGSTMANDWPIYRYADALLYYAEAICRRDGKPDDEAMEMVNMIHRRAYGLSPIQPAANDYKLSDYSTSEKFIDLVLKERGYETCFEGKRYCDLKRCGKLAEYALAAGRVSSESDVKDAAYWWPIPTDEFNYNTALDPTKDQNPGY